MLKSELGEQNVLLCFTEHIINIDLLSGQGDVNKDNT